MGKKLYIVHETALGYLLLERKELEEIGSGDLEIQSANMDFSRFEKAVKVTSFAPFTNPEHALENCNLISEGVLPDFLKAFLQSTLAKKMAKGEVEIGCQESKLASAIHEALDVPVATSEFINETIRLIRFHAPKLIPNLKSEQDLIHARVGLAHAYSRNKVKFNVNRQDNMIIQAIALIDHMDKAMNQLGMRVKEWYGWHFPELAKEVPEPLTYAKVALVIGNRENSLTDEGQEELLSQLTEAVNDELQAQAILEKANNSMGGDIAEIDYVNIEAFALKVKNTGEYRKRLQDYLHQKILVVAPNLSSLMGDQITARLISHAGSLTNLAKAAASTIQILGAEKALFRALKAKNSNTPKYGLIFHSPFISKAAKEHKGKVSRYLANKAALAARIDCFMEDPPTIFGEKLRDQMEERMKFLENGTKPSTNAEVMDAAMAVFNKGAKKARKSDKKDKKRKTDDDSDAEEEKPKKKKKKADTDEDSDDEEQKAKKAKKDKKKKKKAAAEESD